MGNTPSVDTIEPRSKGIVIPDDANEKVQILETFEDSDAESESLSEKIQRLEGYEEVGQCSKQKSDDETQSFWCMANNSGADIMSQVIQDKLTEKTIVSTGKEAPQAET